MEYDHTKNYIHAKTSWSKCEVYVPILEGIKNRHWPLSDMFGACLLMWGLAKNAIGCKRKVDEANLVSFLNWAPIFGSWLVVWSL